MHSAAHTVLPLSASVASTYGASAGPAPITPPRARPPPAGGGVCWPPRPPAGGGWPWALMIVTAAVNPSTAVPIEIRDINTLRIGSSPVATSYDTLSVLLVSEPVRV